MEKFSISAARNQIMAEQDVLNLNAGTCSPVAKPVFEAQVRQLEKQSQAPADYIFNGCIPFVEAGRRSLANFVEASPYQIILATNASYGLNTVLLTLPWQQGDEILTTDQEYHHYEAIFRTLKERRGVNTVRVSLPLGEAAATLTPDSLVQEFVRASSAQTKVMMLSHITSTTGFRLPVAALCHWARRNAILSVIDGAHAPGHIPVSLREIQPDFYAANTHKWMMNPAGCAFLYVAEELRFKFEPLIQMGGFRYIQEEKYEPTRIGCSTWQYAHEYQGTRNMTPFAVLADSIKFFQNIGLPAITARWQEHAAYLRQQLETLSLEIVSPNNPSFACCMLAVRCPTPRGKPVDGFSARMFFRNKHKIDLAFPSLADGSTVCRFSASWFVSKEDLDRGVTALKETDWSQFVHATS